MVYRYTTITKQFVVCQHAEGYRFAPACHLFFSSRPQSLPCFSSHRGVIAVTAAELAKCRDIFADSKKKRVGRDESLMLTVRHPGEQGCECDSNYAPPAHLTTQTNFPPKMNSQLTTQGRLATTKDKCTFCLWFFFLFHVSLPTSEGNFPCRASWEVSKSIERWLRSKAVKRYRSMCRNSALVSNSSGTQHWNFLPRH